LAKNRKGIVLAGGAGTRSASDHVVAKQAAPPGLRQADDLLPARDFDVSGHTRILDYHDAPGSNGISRLARNSGEKWGVSFEYAVQAEPNGIAQALIIAESFLAGAPSALILGDNIFYGANLSELLQKASVRTAGATVFGYYVHDPERYGVVQFGPEGKVVDLLEKPAKPPSNYAVTGVYFYDERAPDITRTIKPSPRGELEITDLNRAYLRDGNLNVERLGRGTAWLDTGTHNSLLDAGVFVRIIEERQGLKVACVEEVAWRMGFIDAAQLERLASPLQKSGYGEYLLRILRDDHQP
jgi:glucose-1-phosphate thymidylyltransferase